MNNNYLKRYIHKFLKDVEKHHQGYYKLLKGKIGEYNSCQLEELMLLIIQELSFFGSIRRKYLFSLCQCVLYGIVNDELTFISINSNALTKDTNNLREKPQYKKIKQIDAKLKIIQRKLKVSINYISILPDYAKEYPLEIYDLAWEKNKKYLEQVSFKKAYRFSELVGNDAAKYEFEIFTNLNIQDLNNKISYYGDNPFITLGFSASKDFQRNQIYSYLFYGAVLEKIIPFAILLDVQKKNFPFEQKFYNYARKYRLPIIFCGQKIK